MIKVLCDKINFYKQLNNDYKLLKILSYPCSTQVGTCNLVTIQIKVKFSKLQNN